MANTLILYEGKYGTSRKTAEIIACIISMARYLPIEEAPRSLEQYENLIIIFSFYGPETAEKTAPYLRAVKGQLFDKKVGLVGVGLAEQYLYRYLAALTNAMDRPEDFSAFVRGQYRISTAGEKDIPNLEHFSKITGKARPIHQGDFHPTDAIEAAEGWLGAMAAETVFPDPKLLRTEADRFIEAHNTCALASGSGDFVRCTPIEYVYHNRTFYLISEGGLKFKGILQNPQVSLAVFDQFHGWDHLEGMQISGRAGLVRLWSAEYTEVLEARKLDCARLKQSPVNMNMIRITPKRVEFLWSGFKEMGLDIRQCFRL